MSLLCVEACRLQRGTTILIDQLTWQVAEGEFWCIVGANGAGKSTLLHTLAGLLLPAAGQITLAGQPLSTIPLPALARLRGLMLQNQQDAFACSVRAAVALGRVPYQWLRAGAAAQDEDIVQQALVATGLLEKSAADIQTLSGGERQRAALAALLAQAPRLLLCDEPTAHQDVAQQLNIMQQLRSLAQSHGVIASCHDINLALRFATHALLIAPGQHWLGPVQQVLRADHLQQAFGCAFEKFFCSLNNKGNNDVFYFIHST